MEISCQSTTILYAKINFVLYLWDSLYRTSSSDYFWNIFWALPSRTISYTKKYTQKSIYNTIRGWNPIYIYTWFHHFLLFPSDGVWRESSGKENRLFILLLIIPRVIYRRWTIQKPAHTNIFLYIYIRVCAYP